MRKLTMLIVTLALLVLIAAPVQAQDQSIIEIASGDSNFSTLVAAVQNADPSVAETLSGEGPFTVFAPTNAAFNNLLAELGLTADELLAETDILTDVLLYHVVDGQFLAEDVVGLDGQSIPTLLDNNFIGVEITEDGGVLLNGVVNVVTPDVLASNGVVHVVDNVLLPQSVIDAFAAETEAETDDMMAEDGIVNIRVAHLSPDTPAVDVYVDGEVALSDLAFGDITDFVTLAAGSYEIAVAPAGTSIDDAAIGPASFDLPADAFITVAAVGSLEAGTLTAAVVVEDFSELNENVARVTVFHAIEGAPAVDVYDRGETRLVFGLQYPGSFTNADGTPNDGAVSVDVPEGTYDLSVVPSGIPANVVIDLSGTTFEGGTYYFVAATNTLDDPQVALVSVDSETATSLRDGEMMGDMGDMGEDSTGDTIADIVIASASGDEPEFTVLLSAIQSADPGVLEALSNPDAALTVFAPTDAAFTALLETLGMSAEDVLAMSDLLTTVLQYHVLDSIAYAEDVVGMDGQSVTTLQGEDITIAIVEGGVVLNDTVNVTMTDIEASNGVIHVIDAVLIPPSVGEMLGTG